MNKRSKLLIILFFYVTSFLSAQNHQMLDSLQKLYAVAKDTSKIHVLYKLYIIERQDRYLDELKALSEKYEYATGMVYYYNILANRALIIDRKSEVLNHLLKAVYYIENYECQLPLKVSIYNTLNLVLYDLGNINLSEEYLNKALILLDQIPSTKDNAYIFVQFLNQYIQKESYEKAKQFVKKYHHIIAQTHEKLQTVNLYVNISIIYDKLNQSDSALYYVNKAQLMINEYANSSNYTPSFCKVYNQKGIVFKKINFDSSLYYFNKSLRMTEHKKNNQMLNKWDAVNHRDLSELYLLKSDIKMAIKHAEQYYNISKKYRFNYDIKKALRMLINLYEARKDYVRLSYFYKQESYINDSLYNELKYLVSINAMLQNKLFENEIFSNKLIDKDKQRDILLKNKNTLQIGLIVGLIIIIVFCIIIFYYSLKYRMTNALFKSQTNDILTKNAQLQHQNKMLEKLNEEKSGLMSVVTHDLKSPINRMEGILELQQNSKTEQEKKVYNAMLKNELSDAKQLINRILETETSTETKLNEALEILDIGDFFQNKIPLFKIMASHKFIDIEFNIVGEDFICLTYKPYLDRISDNIISNAIKFSEFHKTVYVTILEKLETIEIHFNDEGQGMTEEDLTNIFKKYARLSSVPTGGETSTGLGLYIIKKLADEIGIKIDVRSIKGTGTTFILILKKHNNRS